MDQQKLADKIAAGLLRETKRTITPTCWACDRPSIERFCSKNCIEAYDAGWPRNADAPTAADFICVDTSRWKQIAGPPIPACTRCGGLCVEMFKAVGGPFCSWRCRDGKPKDCQVCGKPLYALPRRGPYCSDACAGNLKARKEAGKAGNVAE
jgi:hypothetical protein